MPKEKSDMSNTDMKALAWKILPWLMDTVCALLLFWAAQLNADLKVLKLDLQAIKEWRAETSASRYTAKDHVTFAEANSKELQNLWMKIAEMQQTWLRDISDIKVSLARMPTKDDIQVVDNRLREHVQQTTGKQ